MSDVFNPTGEQLYNATLYTHDSTGEIVNPATKEGQDNIAALLEGLSKEDTLTLVKSALDALVAKDSATSAKQDEIKTVIESLANKDLASDTTLAALKLAVDGLLAKDVATSAKQDVVIQALGTLATESKLELVRVLLASIESKLGTVEVTNLPEVQQVAATEPLPVSINNSDSIATRLAGNSAEVSSAQHTEPAGTTVTYSLADGASKIELYLESGYVRIRTDGQPATATTGEPLGEGFGACWAVDSISVYCVENSVFTVVSRV